MIVLQKQVCGLKSILYDLSWHNIFYETQVIKDLHVYQVLIIILKHVQYDTSKT